MVTIRYEVPVNQANVWSPPPPPPQASAGQPPNDALLSYQLKLMKLEQENKHRLLTGLQGPDEWAEEREKTRMREEQERHYYMVQLKLLEEQNRKRLFVAREERETRAEDQKKTCTLVQPDHQIQPMQLESQKKNEESPMMPRQEQDAGAREQQIQPTTDEAESMAWAMREYRMQKMLLQVQNKKRLAEAAQEQEGLQQQQIPDQAIAQATLPRVDCYSHHTALLSVNHGPERVHRYHFNETIENRASEDYDWQQATKALGTPIKVQDNIKAKWDDDSQAEHSGDENEKEPIHFGSIDD